MSAARLGTHGDPIVAIASAPGRGAVGIVRASGRDLSTLVQALCGRALRPRHATYGPVLDARGGIIDRGLALHFPAPHSYTGEEVLELQVHGGTVLLQLLLARCLEAGEGIGLRLAEPGEFTQRAFLNGKLDLAQAEAVADLIDASTEAAARSAGRALAGEMSAQVQSLGRRTIELRALVEATLDFPEEEIDFLTRAGALQRLDALRADLDALLARTRQGALLREGLTVVLAGQPNVGKSSLLNALAGAELAIVTPIPGTTRDRIAQTIQIQGVPLHVIDTAGLREAAGDEVERLGIERSWEAIGDADVIVFLHDLSRRGDADYEAAESEIARKLPVGLPRLDVDNKADLVSTGPVEGLGRLRLSTRTGEGLEALREALLAIVGWQAMPEGTFIARTRHVQAIRTAQQHLERAAQHAAQRDEALELFAEELRLAHAALAGVTGEITADDLLGEIFGRFCIGK